MHVEYPADSGACAVHTHDWHGLGHTGLWAAGRTASDLYIIRLEGIVLGNGVACPGAAILLRSIAGRFALVSSNSRDTARTMAAKLRRAGLIVPEQRIVLAGEEALRQAASQHPGARCKVLASRVLSHAASSHGLKLVQDNAEVILLGRDSAWTYRDLVLVVHELARGARLIVSNGDMTCIGQGGRTIPDTGAILASIEAAAGKSVEITRHSREATLRAAQQRLGEGGCEALVISNQKADCDAVRAIAGLRCLRFGPGPADASARPGAPPKTLVEMQHDVSRHCSAPVAAPL